MVVYRIGSSKYARDLSGEGARLYGGRWNHKLTPCLYCSANRSLAILEYSVNVNIDLIPRSLSITCLEIPEENILKIDVDRLPGNWRDSPAPASTRDFGTALLKANEFLIIQIPSVVIPEEFNYLVNPLHPASRLVNIMEVKDCVYDLRIKTI